MATVDRRERRNDLENIITQDRVSHLLAVVDEDPVYVAGYYADIRGLPVGTVLQTIRKDAIALRIQITKELRGNPDTLAYSHRKEDRG